MDTLIRNGLLITSKSETRASVGIRDGIIAGVYAPGDEPEAKEVIDAGGLAIQGVQRNPESVFDQAMPLR